MCVSPIIVRGIQVRCRSCWQCLAVKRSDVTGRITAECLRADAYFLVTNTYSDNPRIQAPEVVTNLRSQVLHLRDMQLAFKRMRKDGYRVRYGLAGEYGSLRGRAHWHAIMAFKGAVPPHILASNDDRYEGRHHQKHWPWGWSQWEEGSFGAISYICKYITKDVDDPVAQSVFTGSNNLGQVFFREMALSHVAQGLAPQSRLYRVPGALRRGRGGVLKPEEFCMSPYALDRYLETFLKIWAQVRGGHPPSSDLLEDYCDRVARRVPDGVIIAPDGTKAYAANFQLEKFVGKVSAPWIQPPGGGSVEFDHARNTWFTVAAHGEILFWSFSDVGARAWDPVIRSEREADLLRDAALSHDDLSAEEYRRASGTASIITVRGPDAVVGHTDHETDRRSRSNGAVRQPVRAKSSLLAPPDWEVGAQDRQRLGPVTRSHGLGNNLRTDQAVASLRRREILAKGRKR